MKISYRGEGIFALQYHGELEKLDVAASLALVELVANSPFAA